MPKFTTCHDPQQYDYIIIGSGNGACAFLQKYLACSSKGRLLVLEEGENFFETSDITHQRNWTRSYGEGNIFKLHNAQTPDSTPILSGRACAMGGGGSINYTMIFESSEWLVTHLGHDTAYWDAVRDELSATFERHDPEQSLTDAARYIKAELERQQFTVNEERSGNIPVYCNGKDKQIHIFPTQFNEFGQRTHSGVSLVCWYHNPRLDFMTNRRVTHLQLEEAAEGGQRCSEITVFNLETEQPEHYPLGANTKLLLCAGAATPQLLFEHQERLSNRAIGEHVNDHILLPFGIYLLPEDLPVTLKDQYVSLFATTETDLNGDGTGPTVCNFDFFSGQLDDLIYLISHLFLAFWVPNFLKAWMIRSPRIFQALKLLSRWLIAILNGLDDLLWSILHPGKMGEHRWNLISAIVKFNITRDGYYQPSSVREHDTSVSQNKLYEVILRCFQERPLEKDSDYRTARKALVDQIPLMESLGAKPHPLFQWLIRALTRMPYSVTQVDEYIRHYSQNDLLTEQHLSGGCVFGKAIDLGDESSQDTGKVFGSENIYVADLSASPLPRVSTQMTAYLIGHHIATQHCRASSVKEPQQ